MRRATPLVALITALIGLDFTALPAIAGPVAQASVPAAQAPLPPAPTTPAAPGAPQAVPGPIAAVQQQLRQQGYSPGPTNGVMTDRTERAIALYERRNGRPPDALASAGGPVDPVRRAQAGLHTLGLLPGPPDGAIGPQTRDAIVRFEAAQQLPIDPRVSDGLLAVIDKQSGLTTAAAPAKAQPPATAAETTPPPPASETATGRQPLPPGVSPPPIR